MSAGGGALPGMADPSIAVYELLCHMSQRLRTQTGLHLFVSHDSIVASSVARLMGADLPADLWPEFLEVAAFLARGRRGDWVLSWGYAPRCDRGVVMHLRPRGLEQSCV